MFLQNQNPSWRRESGWEFDNLIKFLAPAAKIQKKAQNSALLKKLILSKTYVLGPFP